MNFENQNDVLQDQSLSNALSFAEKYAEAAIREYEINKSEAEILLLESAIDTDTYLSMMSESSQIFCEKMEKKSSSLAEKMKNSMNGLKRKLLGDGKSNSSLSKLDKFKKLITLNPDIGNKKVSFSDKRDRLKKIHDQRSELLSLAAKQKATKKFDKEPFIKHGKKWEEYQRQQKTKEFKKDVTVAIASGIAFDLINRATAWVNNESAKEQMKYNEIVNPPKDLSDDLKATYCCMRDIVESQYNALNQEEQAIICGTVQELEDMYQQFEPDFRKRGINYQEVWAKNAMNNGWGV